MIQEFTIYPWMVNELHLQDMYLIGYAIVYAGMKNGGYGVDEEEAMKLLRACMNISEKYARHTFKFLAKNKLIVQGNGWLAIEDMR